MSESSGVLKCQARTPDTSWMPTSARSHLTAAAFALVALAVPATATAGTTVLRGQVIGTPYVSGASTAVPVLISKQSAAQAKLASPVGVLLLSRSRLITGPAKTSFKPSRLRVGDSFRASTTVDSRARRSVYAAIKAKKLLVIKRSTVLSNDELTAQLATVASQLASVTKQLNSLSAAVTQLANYTVTQISSLRADLAGVKADLADLRAQLAALSSSLTLVQTQLGGLNNLPAGLVDTVNSLSSQLGSLSTTVSSLGTTVTGLAGTVGTLTTGLSTVTGTVTGLTGTVGTLTTGLSTVNGILAGITPGQLAAALTDIASLQSAVAGLNVPAITAQLASLTSKIGAVGGVDLQTQLNTLSGLLGSVQTTLGTATGQLSFLCSAKLVTNPLGGLISLLGLGSLGTITSCP